MNSILTDFFNGLITPSEKAVPQSAEYKATVDRIIELMNMLHEALESDEAECRLDELHECFLTQMDCRAEECFKSGFSLGLRMAMEACAKDEVLLKLLNKMDCPG